MVDKSGRQEIHPLDVATRSVIKLKGGEDVKDIFISFSSFLEIVVVWDSPVNILFDLLVLSAFFEIIGDHRGQSMVRLTVSLIVKGFG